MAELMVTGGTGRSSLVPNSEIYDPETGEWELLGNHTRRVFQTAVLLPDGSAFVTGGSGDTAYQESAEAYSPITDAWTRLEPMTYGRSGHTAALFDDGRVIVIGGIGLTASGNVQTHRSTEVFDPVDGIWSNGGQLQKERSGHAMTVLPDGRIFVVGGTDDIGFLASAEMYDPATDEWTTLGEMHGPRLSHRATALPDGRVLVSGGFTGSDTIASLEIYDPGR